MCKLVLHNKHKIKINIYGGSSTRAVVMCELVWVLERGYKYSKEAISAVIKQMLSTEEFAFENQKLLWLALNQYNQNRLDFSEGASR